MKKKRAVIDKVRQWQARNPDKCWMIASVNNWKASGIVGMTPEKYLAMLAEQHGVCAVCQSPPTAHRRLAVDHDHLTGTPRSLLCSVCNALAQDIHRVRAVLQYLEIHAATAAYVHPEDCEHPDCQLPF
jgi:formate dehydrogenase maturation protein FdhE